MSKKRFLNKKVCSKEKSKRFSRPLHSAAVFLPFDQGILA
ncbi:hypothetical protein D932_03744 [Enterococcus casseliflavus 14-MB-W-14]|nr:hypothetical protein D932_03744 [Enterococcus casseliflavus 14-MB-W-14]